MAETALIAGYYGRRNAGDEAILAGMLAELRSVRDDLRFKAVSWNPEGTRRLHGIEAIPWADVHGLIEAVRGASLVIVGGGGLFHDHWGVEPEAMLSSRQAGIAQYGAPIVLARLLGVPSMLYAVGVGPVATEQGRRLTRELFDAADGATVRDAGSRELLAELGRPVEGIEVVPDPAFHLPPSVPDPVVEAVLHSLPRPILGVSLRHWAFGVDPADWQAQVAAALDTHLAGMGGTALFVPLQDGEWEVEDDVRASRTVMARMGRSAHTALIPDALDPLQRFRLLEACDAVLGMRLHAAVAALRGGRPVVALAYDPKVTALMVAAGVHEEGLAPTDWTAKKIGRSLAKAAADHDGALDGRRRFQPPGVSAVLAAELIDRGRAKVAPGEAAVRRVAMDRVRAAHSFEALSGHLRLEIEQKSKQLASQAEEIGRLRRVAEEQGREIDELASKLTSLRATLGVRVLARYWSWARRALPPGSRRRRLAASVRRLVLGGPALGVATGTAPNRLSGLASEELKVFLGRHSGADVPLAALILAPTPLDLDEGQRSTHLARELARRHIPVVFGYWRWRPEQRRPQDQIEYGILQLPLDELMAAPSQVLNAFSGARRLLLLEFPYPRFFGLAGAARGRGWISIYDVVDDWREFHRAGQAPWYRTDFEAHLLSTADAVTAVSPSLVRRVREISGRDAELIPNGVSLDIANVDKRRHLERGSITLGYFGHLTRAWFDWDLVRRVALRQPDWLIHLVGYGEQTPATLPRNMILHGKVPRKALSSYAANWDVGIIPFKRGALAASADPIKLYEYLALGLPVVATGVNPSGADGLASRANSEESFIAEVMRAAGGRSDVDRRRAFAAGCQWEKRVDGLLNMIERGSQRIALQEALFEAAA